MYTVKDIIDIKTISIQSIKQTKKNIAQSGGKDSRKIKPPGNPHAPYPFSNIGKNTTTTSNSNSNTQKTPKANPNSNSPITTKKVQSNSTPLQLKQKIPKSKICMNSKTKTNKFRVCIPQKRNLSIKNPKISRNKAIKHPLQKK